MEDKIQKCIKAMSDLENDDIQDEMRAMCNRKRYNCFSIEDEQDISKNVDKNEREE